MEQEEYNLALGDLRANSVANYLQDLGIDPIRISTVSMGSLEAQIGLSKKQIQRETDGQFNPFEIKVLH